MIRLRLALAQAILTAALCLVFLLGWSATVPTGTIETAVRVMAVAIFAASYSDFVKLRWPRPAFILSIVGLLIDIALWIAHLAGHPQSQQFEAGANAFPALLCIMCALSLQKGWRVQAAQMAHHSTNGRRGA